LRAKTRESKNSDSHSRTREPFATTEYYLQSEPPFYFVTSLFEFFLKIFIVIPCIELIRTPFFVARYPDSRRREVRNVNNASKLLETFFLTLNTVLFQKFIYLSVAKRLLPVVGKVQNLSHIAAAGIRQNKL
jgi:hypothetical protein